MASDTCEARAGTAASAGSANWATAPQLKKIIPWLPTPGTPLFVGGPPVSREYRRFFEEIAIRLGGIDGVSIPNVIASVASVQDAVLLAQAIAITAQSDAAANSAAIDVVRDVAIGNGLTGAEQIP